MGFKIKNLVKFISQRILIFMLIIPNVSSQEIGDFQMFFSDSVSCEIYLNKCKNSLESDCSSNITKNIILNNLKYPSLALENGKEGTVLLGWTVNDSGNIDEVKILHHFGQNSDVEIDKMIKKSDFKNLKYNYEDCEEKDLKILFRVPIVFKIESSKKPYLWDFEQLVCERDKHFKEQKIKKKKLVKYYQNSPDVEEMWLYKYDLAKFIKLEIGLFEAGELIEKITDIKTLKSKKVSQLIERARKGNLMKVTITDSISNQKVEFEKIIQIK